MTTLVRVQHILHGRSELPEDQFVNSFHFVRASGAATGITDAEAAALVSVVNTFYTGTTNPTGQALFDFFGQEVLATNPHHTKVYDMDIPPPRAPKLDTRPPSQPARLTTFRAMVHEVACCLSYQGVAVSGLPQARRRGRLYLGPLNTAAGNQDGNMNQRPDAGFTAAARAAAQRLKTAATAAGWTWVVYSPTDRAAGVPGTTGNVPVASVWTDDAWDIQRRRGIAPTGKTVGILT